MEQKHSLARMVLLQAIEFHVDWEMLCFEAHSQGVVEVGSKAEELDQGPERRLRVPTKKPLPSFRTDEAPTHSPTRSPTSRTHIMAAG
jgi:hypothetical protein